MDEGRKYTLQVAETVEVPYDEAAGGAQESAREAWFDVATVTVPPRTKTLTALRRAAKETGVEIPEDGLRVRLLPPGVAEPITLLGPAPQPGPRQVRL